MHICYIADINSVHVHRWVAFFVGRGHRVSVLTDVEGTVPEAEVYNTGDCLMAFRLPLFSAFYQILKKAWQMRKVIRKIKPDIVHGHYATNYGFLAALTGFQPLVQTVHGSDVLVDANGSWVQRFFVRHALRKAVWITSVAEHMTARLVAFGLPEERITTIQYGVDTSIFTPPETENLRNPRLVVSTRFFEWKYNIDLLIRAIPKIRDAVPDVSVILAGDGPDRAALEQLVGQLDVGSCTRMIGRVAHESMPGQLQSATVYVSTSVTDGSSLSLLEAMSCGAVPVVTDIPANREWITHGENGFLIEVGHVEALADHVTRILMDVDLQTRIRDRNFNLVQARGDYQTNMARIEKTYEKLCE